MEKILHFKKHKACNLHCEGCISSIQSKNTPDIQRGDNPDILETLAKINSKTNPQEDISYSISFLGGEPLMSVEDLHYYLDFVEENKEIVKDFGIQTNLVFESEILKGIVEHKDELSGRIGTSYNFNKTRTLGGSHKLFKDSFLENYSTLSESLDYNIPIIVVVTENNVSDMFRIYSFLNKRDIDVTFFHFLPMGKKTQYFEYYNKQNFHKTFSANLIKISEDKNKKIRVEPIDKIVAAFSGGSEYGCGMQQDCFRKSFCVEADGNVYVCPELSAQKRFPLGNWKNKEVYEDNISTLKRRMTSVDRECLDCEFYSVCRSGCMAESLVSNMDLYGKTYMCESWKGVFNHLKGRGG